MCNVVTEGGPFGPYQFTPSYYGAAAYFQALNAFDFVNRNYSMWGGGFQNVGGPPASQYYDPGSVASQGRNFKIGARYQF